MLVPLPSYFGSPFPVRPLPLLTIGHWFALKYRRQAATGGVYRTACNLRKQGVPLDIALAILAPRS